MNRCLGRLGALPKKLVWDREGAIHAGGGRPTDAFAAYCGALGVGWIILAAGDCQAKGSLERDHRYLHGNFEAARSFANPADFQAQLDGWSDRINARKHRSTRAVVFERLATEHERMRPLRQQGAEGNVGAGQEAADDRLVPGQPGLRDALLYARLRHLLRVLERHDASPRRFPDLLAGRAQMGTSLAFHIIFASLGATLGPGARARLTPQEPG